MYKDDIKIFAKNKKEQEILVETIKIYSQDIGMDFGIEKHAMHMMKSGVRETMERIKLPHQESIRREGKSQVLGNIKSGHHQTD